MIDKETILSYKERIDKMEKQVAVLEGKEQEILSRMKEEFSVSNLKEAKAKLKELKDRKESLEKELEQKSVEIENFFEGLDDKLREIGIL